MNNYFQTEYDGWFRVRKRDGKEGIVPASYVEYIVNFIQNFLLVYIP